jgi:LytS/YehU family sensor histidine kinase
MPSCTGSSIRNEGSVTIDAVVSERKLKLTVRDTGAGLMLRGTGNEALDGIRERLAALYGADASLELHDNDQCGTEAVMEIPHERTESGHR